MAELEPAYLVLGTDHTKVATTIARLKSHFAEDAIEQHMAFTASAEEITAGAAMMGLLAERKLVIVTGVDAWRAEDAKALTAYLASPSPDTVLLFTADKFDGGSAVKKALAKVTTIDCGGPKGAAEVARWVTGRFREHGVSVDQKTALALVNACGEDSLDRLESDIARIATWAGPGTAVDAAVINELATHHTEEKVWGLTDAWAARDRAALLALTEQLLSQKEGAVRLAGVIARHLRYVHMARRLLETESASQVVATLGQHGLQPWGAKKAVQQAQRISQPQVDAALARVAQLQAELQGGSNLGSNEVLLERGLLELV